MAITAKWYPSAANQMFQGNLLASDTFKVALLNSSGSYSASHTAYSDVSANELAATGGYTTGGATVAGGVTGSSNSAASSFTMAAAVSWDPATFTVDNAVIYEAGTGKLMIHLAFSPAVAISGQVFTINPPSSAATIAPA